ncbi:MAG TPA: LLM class flavin-dependent oxidoreductase [Acidimicrobiales bacterium]|nr:LLM class flavin-dependent oxidoreductase [Acidimicrobiales bacterium]
MTINALSVLDQSPMPEGSSASEVLANTVELAQLTERLGYRRYWLAEHHGTLGLAGSAPEILIAHVAAHTTSIRVGSGGVMLSHYSPLKVAEQFHLLESLHPGRIDLGLGRAPGGEPLTSIALQRNREHPAGDDFLEQLAELVAWFGGRFPEQHPFARLAATPLPEGNPPIWLLSSSGYSAAVAGHYGMGLCFAHFISDEGGPAAVEHYRARFTEAWPEDEPQATFAVGVICAESDAEADELATSADLWRLRSRRYNERGPVPSVASARAFPYSPTDRSFIEQSRQKLIVGSPGVVRERLETLAAAYGAEEIVIVTVIHDHAARLRSYELLAETFIPSGAAAAGQVTA